MIRDVEMGDASSEKKDEWVRITSRDGFSFIVKRKVAICSGTLKNMLESNFREALDNTCPVDGRAVVVEKVCEYMSFKSYHDGAGSKEEVFPQEFLERIPPELALELLMTADYLDV